MLDRAKVLQELQQVSDILFVDRSHEYSIAKLAWHRIAADEFFLEKLQSLESSPWPIPFWEGQLDDAIDVFYDGKPYVITSVDGSQIYPDRHQNVSCFLINRGDVVLSYGVGIKPCSLSSEPFIFTQQDTEFDESFSSTEFVNCKRQEIELGGGYCLTKEIQATLKELKHDVQPLLLFDGSLIFWHLESRPKLRDLFVPRYLAYLHQLYQQKILCAGYISMPKSKELLNLIRLMLCEFDVSRKDLYSVVDPIVDAGIARFFLQPNQRSIVFQNNAPISKTYPDHIRPYFFYMHVGNEIGRVEIPAWIAQDEQKTNYVAHIILDQCTKGNGYPVVIAEAHEQAVVKGPDRDFFYHLLSKLGIERKQKSGRSAKLNRKLRVGF